MWPGGKHLGFVMLFVLLAHYTMYTPGLPFNKTVSLLFCQEPFCFFIFAKSQPFGDLVITQRIIFYTWVYINCFLSFVNLPYATG